MLNPNFTAVGIGHVYYYGYDYWVQVFRAPVGSAAATSANDSETTVSVDILQSVITDFSVTSDKASLAVPYGSTVELPQAVIGLRTQNTWPARIVPVQLPYEWSVSGTDCISISSGKISGGRAGTSSITTTVQGQTLTIPVTVTPLSVSSASISLADVSCVYDGTAKTPGVSSVMLDGKKLTAGTDYTVSYTQNVNAGTVKVTVTGIGNYTGTATKTFQITPADLSTCTISEIPTQTYAGKELTPEITVSGGTSKLTKGTDYTVSYADNINAGIAKATVAGLGNYKGTVTRTFQIQKADISKGTVSDIGNCIYTGKAITPSVVVKYASRTLKSGTDYIVTFANNTKVGTATVTVKGIGNYQGTLSKNFRINEPVTPAKGKKVQDKATGAYYTITKAGTSGTATVEYTKPVSRKSSAAVPDMVVINHVTCKVTSIASGAFKNNKTVKTVTIGKNVTKIGKNAFYGCTKLQKVTIGSKVTAIGDGAFYGCTKLNTLTIGAKVTSIGAKAFSKCTSLKKVTIPASVTKIGSQAFYGCKNLKTITIKTTKLTAKTVGSKAFGGIYSKASFKVPSGKVNTYKKLLTSKGISSKAKMTK